METMMMVAKSERDMYEAQTRIAETLLKKIKAYFKENGNVICAGFAAMAGDYRSASALMRK